MTIYSGIFNSVRDGSGNGDRKYNAWWFAKYFSTFIGNGVFPNPSTNLQVMAYEQMKVVVKPGSGWIDGYFIYSDSDHVLKLDIADGALKRIDRIVMRLNYLTRMIEIDVKKGAFASSPVAPILQRDTDYVELALADVYITNGATQITQANITDTRLNNALCGIVHGTVNQVDTTTLYNQYLTYWNTWRTQKTNEFEQFQVNSQNAFNSQTSANQQTFNTQIASQQTQFNQQKNSNQNTFDNQILMNQQEFADWFADIQAQLDGDIATNLANQITQTNTNLSSLQHQNNQHITDAIKHITSAERTKWNNKIDADDLVDSVTSDSKTTAATSNSVKIAYDVGLFAKHELGRYRQENITDGFTLNDSYLQNGKLALDSNVSPDSDSYTTIGQSFDHNEGNLSGISITLLKRVTKLTVTKYTSLPANMAYIYDSSNNLIKTATIINSVAVFDGILNPGTYKVLVNQGRSYYAVNTTTPINKTMFTIDNGLHGINVSSLVTSTRLPSFANIAVEDNKNMINGYAEKLIEPHELKSWGFLDFIRTVGGGTATVSILSESNVVIKSNITSPQDISDIDSVTYPIIKLRFNLSRTDLTQTSPTFSKPQITYKAADVLLDEVTGKPYKLFVSNGTLGIREV